MGYYSINSVEILRESGEIRVVVYCNETGNSQVKTFAKQQLHEALLWVEEQMSKVSM